MKRRMRPTSRPGRMRPEAAPSAPATRWGSVVAQMGALTGLFAGGAVLLYLFGGTVMWLRFRHLGLPSDQAVALVSNADLVVVGLRALVLPTVVVGGALSAMTVIYHRHGLRHTSQPRALVILLGPVIAVLMLVVPLSLAGLAWPAAVVVLLVVWLRMLATRRRSEFPVRIAVVAIMLAAAFFALSKEWSAPGQLPSVSITLVPLARESSGFNGELSGVLITQTNGIALGLVPKGTISIYPREQVRSIRLGQPLAAGPPPRQSLLSGLLSSEGDWSVTPLSIWCSGEEYSWLEVGIVCRTQPQLRWKTPQHRRDFDRLGAPVRVSCPQEARGGCRGWVLLRSRALYLHGPAGVRRPVVPEPVRFALGAGRSTEVCLTLTPGQFGLLRQGAGEKPVAFDAVIAQDREGETVFERGYYGLHVGRGGVEPRPLGASDCEPRLALAAAMKGTAVRVTVTARPRGRGFTPRRVEGAVRLRATRRDGTVRRLGTARLRGGEAHVATTLPRGTWEIAARYTSIVRVHYPEVLATRTVTVTRRERPARARSGLSDGTAAPG